MRTSVILFLLLVCGKLNAQSFIEIIPTGGLDDKTCSNINNLLHDLNKGKTGQKAKYIFIIRNIYDENAGNIKTTTQNPLGPDNNFPAFLNFTIKSKESLTNNIITLAEPNDHNIYYSPDKFNNINSKQIVNHVHQDKLLSSIKKNIKKKRIRIFYDNGLIPYAYSMERLDEYLDKNDCESIKIQSIFDSNGREALDGHQFRPASAYYQIKFDTLGFFDNYEIEIYKDDNIFFHETLFINNYQDLDKDFDLVVKPKSKKATIYLHENYLGKICINKFGGDAAIRDPTCSCQQLCLYERNFNMRIRGVIQDDTKDCLWFELKAIEFQCPVLKTN